MILSWPELLYFILLAWRRSKALQAETYHQHPIYMFPSLSTINTAAIIRTNFRIWYYSVVRNMERRRQHILISHTSAEEREVVGGGEFASWRSKGEDMESWKNPSMPRPTHSSSICLHYDFGTTACRGESIAIQQNLYILMCVTLHCQPFFTILHLLFLYDLSEVMFKSSSSTN